MSSSNCHHARQIVNLLSERLGAEHNIYLGQKGDVIAMSFGPSDEVGVYLHPNRLDVTPKVVEAIGGRSALNALYPGFVQPPGQRSRYARFVLPS